MAGNSQEEQDVNFIEQSFERINLRNTVTTSTATEDNEHHCTAINCTRCGSRPSKPDKYCSKCSTNVANGKITKKVAKGKAGGKFTKEKLPPEVLSQIMSFLNESELLTCTEVNREFREKAKEELSARDSKDESTTTVYSTD